MEYLRDLKKHLNKLTQEVVEMKRIVIYQGVVDKQKTEEAWNDLMLASDEISEKWRGLSALEEITYQREKA